MNSSEGINSIQVLTESWKYENTLLEKFDLEAFKSFSKSDNNDKGTGGPKGTKTDEKDNVVDADFEDVKEDKEKSA